MFSKEFFKTLLPPLTQLQKQIQLQLGHVTFLGLTELAPLIMKLLRKMQGKKERSQTSKEMLFPNKNKMNTPLSLLISLSDITSGAFLGNKRDCASSNGATRIL